MSGDDTTKNLSGDNANTTQPMIGEVFKLVEQLKLSMETRFDEISSHLDETNARLDETNARLDAANARLDVTNARLDEIEARLARDIEGVNARVADVADAVKEVGYKMNALNRSRLQTEADYENLFERIRELESKTS